MPKVENANLPRHCGNCIHLQWEEDICICTNPCFVDEKCITDGFEIWEDENDVVELAQNIYDYWLEDQCDWHNYDFICPLWSPRCEESDAESRAFQKFCRHVERMWNGKNKN
jgi:hypothetical protein